MKYVLIDTVNRMIAGPMGSPILYDDEVEAKKAALRRVEPTRVATLKVVFDPLVVN